MMKRKNRRYQESRKTEENKIFFRRGQKSRKPLDRIKSPGKEYLGRSLRLLRDIGERMFSEDKGRRTSDRIKSIGRDYKGRKHNFSNKGMRMEGEETKRSTAGASNSTRFFSSKGQNPLISHVLTILFLMILVGVIVSSLNTIRNDYRDFVGRHEIQNVCAIIKSGIEKIYFREDYNSSANATSRIFVNLPERIGDMNYRARFVNDSVSIETLTQPALNDTCRIGFNITYRGSTPGGRTEMNYTRFADGTNLIMMGRA